MASGPERVEMTDSPPFFTVAMRARASPSAAFGSVSRGVVSFMLAGPGEGEGKGKRGVGVPGALR